MSDFTTVRDVTIDLLRAFGMTTIFGNPGSTELPMFRNFPDDFRYILGLQEAIVLGMADGYAQATGQAAFVNLHSSAGVGHALGNLFTAYRNQTPIVVTAGQQARSILPYEPYLFAERASEFPHPFIKWAIEPARAEDVPAAIARAYYIAMQHPRGPTFVSVPVDDWDRHCSPLSPRRIGTSIQGDAEILTECALALATARNPAFVVGAGVARDGAWREMIALAEYHQAAVWCAPMSARNSFPEDHPLFAGFLPASREKIVTALEGVDVLVVLGGPLSLYHTEGHGPHVPDRQVVFHLVDNEAQATSAPIGTAAIGNVKMGITDLLKGPTPIFRAAPPPRPTPAPLDGTPLTDGYLLQQIATLRPHDAIIVEEAPSSRAPMHDHLPMIRPDSFYAGASGGLGHGLPAAIGVALGRTDRKVIALLGDGSAMYAIQGLWSAAQLGLPISFIIVKNSRYEALVQFGRLFGLQQTVGTSLPDMDFCGLARAQGISAVSIEDAADLDAALAASFAADRPTLVEVVVQ